MNKAFFAGDPDLLPLLKKIRRNVNPQTPLDFIDVVGDLLKLRQMLKRLYSPIYDHRAYWSGIPSIFQTPTIWKMMVACLQRPNCDGEYHLGSITD